MTANPENKKITYRFGRYEVDAENGFLRRDSEILPLTPKIFETLLLLVKNNGRMLGKNEIMETVWADSFVEETNLTSNISRLRKILHADGEQYIETFSKRGYRFQAEVEEISHNAEIVLTRRTVARVRRTIEEADDAENSPEYLAYLGSVPNNLSLPPNPLIGREKEIAEIENLFGRTRLLTLTGIGGTGKTRLAQEIALRMLADFPDGVFFVALDAIRNAELAIPAFAQIFGVTESSEKTLLENLVNCVREKRILIVADNFEQIVSEAALLQKILNAAPHLVFLVTSRIRLHLKAEREYCVPPLALPENGANNSFAETSNYEAVVLFDDRARAAKRNFSLTGENARTIAEICTRLDGLPLAIELAAARVKILSPEQILSRLENRLKLLTGVARNLPARQQTMRAAIEWSYDLLDENDRVLFRRLAVFAGGFTIEAAEAFAGSDARSSDAKGKFKDYDFKYAFDANKSSKSLVPDAGAPQIDVLSGITSLIENNLVVQTEMPNGESRFRLLEVVREYALEVLEASGEAEMMRKKHAAFYLRLAEDANFDYYGEREAQRLDQLEEENDNLRAALANSIVGDADMAMKLAAALRRFWLLHNHLTEARRWLEAALGKSDGVSAELRGKLLFGLAQAALYQGDNETARKRFADSLALAEAGDDKRQIALSNRGLGAAAKQQGDVKTAKKYMKEGLKISRESSDALGIAVSLNNLGDIARMENDFAVARSLLEESLTISRSLGNSQGVCGTSNNLGAVAFYENDYESARDYFIEAIELGQKLGDKISVSYSLDGFAALAARRKASEQAACLARAAELLRETLGFESEPAERDFREFYFAEIRAVTDDFDYSKACEKGSRLKLEEAVALALASAAIVPNRDKPNER